MGTIYILAFTVFMLNGDIIGGWAGHFDDPLKCQDAAQHVKAQVKAELENMPPHLSLEMHCLAHRIDQHAPLPNGGDAAYRL